MVVMTKDMNLRKKFKVGQTIKIKSSEPGRKKKEELVDESEIGVIRPGTYKVIAIHRFFLLCLDSFGRKTCICWGDIVMNGLLG